MDPGRDKATVRLGRLCFEGILVEWDGGLVREDSKPGCCGRRIIEKLLDLGVHVGDGIVDVSDVEEGDREARSV